MTDTPNAASYGETDKSLVTAQEAVLFNIDEVRIARMIVDHLACEFNQVQRSTTFESLDADSLDVVELVMALEEEFPIQISDDARASVVTVNDLFRVVAEAPAA